jgi:hypothetical protein
MRHPAALWLIMPVLGISASLAAKTDGTHAPIALWGQFTTESTSADVKAFKASLEKKRVEVLPGCDAPIGYRTEKKALVTIIFAAQDGDADCHARLLRQLREDKGEPEIGQTTFGSVIGYGNGGVLDTTSSGVVLIWRDGEKKTKLIKTPGNGYNLIFTVREDKYIY